MENTAVFLPHPEYSRNIPSCLWRVDQSRNFPSTGTLEPFVRSRERRISLVLQARKARNGSREGL